MLDIASYDLPTNVRPHQLLIGLASVYAIGFKIWGPAAAPAQPGGVDPDKIRKSPPKRGARRIVEMVIMFVVSVGSVALGIDTGPRLYGELWGHLIRIGERDSLFTLGLFAAAVALTLFAVREFYKLLRA